jgi:uncharacterized Zn finger protein (UPF0148 family)
MAKLRATEMCGYCHAREVRPDGEILCAVCRAISEAEMARTDAAQGWYAVYGSAGPQDTWRS